MSVVEIPNEQFDDMSRDKTKVGQPAWCQEPEFGFVFIRCPNCCCPATLGAGHTIAKDGTVSPSMWCQCNPAAILGNAKDWHIFGKLVGWTDEHAAKRNV